MSFSISYRDQRKATLKGKAGILGDVGVGLREKNHFIVFQVQNFLKTGIREHQRKFPQRGSFGPDL